VSVVVLSARDRAVAGGTAGRSYRSRGVSSACAGMAQPNIATATPRITMGRMGEG
jgi:hypothetical protein